MKVLVLTDHFYPDLSSGGRLLTELSEDLVRQGVDVEVITAVSRYNTEKIGRARETYKGIKITRTPSTQFPRHSLLGRLINEVSFSVTASLRALIVSKPNVLLVASSPPFLSFFVALLTLTRRLPYVYLMWDVFPDIAIKMGLLTQGTFIVRVWERVAEFALRRATRIVVLGRCMRDVISEKLAYCPVPCDVIHNWADRKKLKPLDREENPFFQKHPLLRDKFIVQYSGNLGRFQDFETILSAAAILGDEPSIVFLIIGEGARRQWIVEEVEKRNLKNTVVLPFQPQEDLLFSLNAADVSLVTLERGAEGLGVPSKFYPILAVAKPVIALMEAHAEVARTVEEAEIGRVVRQGDAGGLAGVIRCMSANPKTMQGMGVRAHQLFLRKFERSLAVNEFKRTLSLAAAAKRGAKGIQA